MKTTRRLRVLGTLVVAGATVLSGGSAMAVCKPHPPKALTCTGGEIQSGSYSRILVKGQCSVAADATVKVLGNVTVAAGAVFDAQSAPSRISIGGSVTGAAGSLVGLGCQPEALVGNSAHPCTTEPDGHSTIRVNGNITVVNAAAVLLNGITAKRNVTLVGGGSDIPWSIKNNTFGRNVTITGQQTEWVGVMFNKVGGNVTLVNIALSDPDPGAPGVYIVKNTVRRNLICTGLTPGVSGGFDPTGVNVVGGRAIGQCAALV